MDLPLAGILVYFARAQDHKDLILIRYVQCVDGVFQWFGVQFDGAREFLTIEQSNQIHLVVVWGKLKNSIQLYCCSTHEQNRYLRYESSALLITYKWQKRWMCYRSGPRAPQGYRLSVLVWGRLVAFWFAANRTDRNEIAHRNLNACRTEFNL